MPNKNPKGSGSMGPHEKMEKIGEGLLMAFKKKLFRAKPEPAPEVKVFEPKPLPAEPPAPKVLSGPRCACGGPIAEGQTYVCRKCIRAS